MDLQKIASISIFIPIKISIYIIPESVRNYGALSVFVTFPVNFSTKRSHYLLLEALHLCQCKLSKNHRRLMIHPHTKLAFINDTIGHGIIATKLIPAGTITWILDDLDMEFTPNQVQRMPVDQKQYLDTYCYRNSKGNLILCWDHSRFVNHSFSSNCMSTAYDFEIAIRDIHPGEQLTDDYGYLNVEHPFEPLDEDLERKIVEPDDLLHYHGEWDAQLREIFPRILKLPQPLQEYFKDNRWKTLIEIATGKRKMASILENYYDPIEQMSIK